MPVSAGKRSTRKLIFATASPEPARRIPTPAGASHCTSIAPKPSRSLRGTRLSAWYPLSIAPRRTAAGRRGLEVGHRAVAGNGRRVLGRVVELDAARTCRCRRRPWSTATSFELLAVEREPGQKEIRGIARGPFSFPKYPGASCTRPTRTCGRTPSSMASVLLGGSLLKLMLVPSSVTAVDECPRRSAMSSIGTPLALVIETKATSASPGPCVLLGWGRTATSTRSSRCLRVTERTCPLA